MMKWRCCDLTYYIEPVEELSETDRDIQRALNSLKEEIEAINWYHQRAAVHSNPDLKAVLMHNLKEEIEHASMLLEWLRRQMSGWNESLKMYLFTTQPLVEIESSASPETSVTQSDLGIGSLK